MCTQRREHSALHAMNAVRRTPLSATGRAPDPQLAGAEFRRILVMCLSGFGDTIMATPMLQALRASYPQAEIVGLAMWRTSAVLLERLGLFDQVVHHNFLRGSLARSLRRVSSLRRRRFDLSLLAFPANRAHYNVLARLVHARTRLGHDYLVGNSFTYGRFLLTHRVPQTSETHNVAENLKLAEALGASDCEATLAVGRLGADSHGWARALLASRPPPYIGIHPGCSPLKNQLERRWPAARFGRLASALQQHTGGTSLVFLGPDELGIAGTIAGEAPRALLLAGRSIDDAAALLAHCHLVVCCDSSLGHLAAALKVPVASIFGPTNPTYTHPWGVPHCVITRGFGCSPCFEVSRRPLECTQKMDFACIRGLPLSTVLAACTELLNTVLVREAPAPARLSDVS